MLCRLRPLTLSVAVLLGPRAAATWSICAVDTSTGEVVVASATCLEDFNLQQALPAVLVGVGGAAAQSQIDMNAVDRQKISDALLAGATAQEVATSPRRATCSCARASTAW